MEEIYHVLNALLGAYIVKIKGEAIDIWFLLRLLLLFFIENILITENVLFSEKDVILFDADILFLFLFTL